MKYWLFFISLFFSANGTAFSFPAASKTYSAHCSRLEHSKNIETNITFEEISPDWQKAKTTHSSTSYFNEITHLFQKLKLIRNTDLLLTSITTEGRPARTKCEFQQHEHGFDFSCALRVHFLDFDTVSQTTGETRSWNHLILRTDVAGKFEASKGMYLVQWLTKNPTDSNSTESIYYSESYPIDNCTFWSHFLN